jgi:hypothetical protein
MTPRRQPDPFRALKLSATVTRGDLTLSAEGFTLAAAPAVASALSQAADEAVRRAPDLGAIVDAVPPSGAVDVPDDDAGDARTTVPPACAPPKLLGFRPKP